MKRIIALGFAIGVLTFSLNAMEKKASAASSSSSASEQKGTKRAAEGKVSEAKRVRELLASDFDESIKNQFDSKILAGAGQLVQRHNPEKSNQFSSQAPRFIGICGPNGTGKTTIARAIVQKLGAHALEVKAEELILENLTPHSNTPNTKTLCTALVTLFGKARQHTNPAVIINNYQKLLTHDSNLLIPELIKKYTQEYPLLVLAETTDESFRELFDRTIDVTLPSKITRKKIIDNLLQQHNATIGKAAKKELIKDTEDVAPQILCNVINQEAEKVRLANPGNETITLSKKAIQKELDKLCGANEGAAGNIFSQLFGGGAEENEEERPRPENMYM